MTLKKANARNPLVTGALLAGLMWLAVGCSGTSGDGTSEQVDSRAQDVVAATEKELTDEPEDSEAAEEASEVIEPSEELTPEEVLPRGNDPYTQQDFSEVLFSEIRQLDQFCFGISVGCVYREFTFKDAVLVAEPYEYGATNVSLRFNQPVSMDEAITYSKILDARGEINFDSVDPQPDRNVYTGCWEREAGGEENETVPMCTVTNVVESDGTVSEISIRYTTP